MVVIELLILCIVIACFMFFTREKFVLMLLELFFSLHLGGRDAEDFVLQGQNQTIFICRYIFPPVFMGFLVYCFAFKFNFDGGSKLGVTIASCALTILFSWLIHGEKSSI